MFGYFLVSQLLLVTVSLNSISAFTLHKIVKRSMRKSPPSDGPLSKVTAVTAVEDSKIIGLDAPESVIAKSAKEVDEIAEADYIVIGSGIGGLSAAALLSYYGYSVVVLESHYLPGGVAHTFEREGFHFDAGPSLWNGMATKPYNPLREVIVERS